MAILSIPRDRGIWRDICHSETLLESSSGVCGSQHVHPHRNSELRYILFVGFGKSGPVMARACEVCGKSPQVGNMIETRGKAKYLGGVGTKITGITRRRFLPNLQNIKASLPSGEVKTMRVCTQCIRSGRIRKAVRNKPFSLPTN